MDLKRLAGLIDEERRRRGADDGRPESMRGAADRMEISHAALIDMLYEWRCALPRTRAGVVENRIEVNPAVMLGTPVIRGTRIPVELIIRKLAEGATEADLLDAYPRLTRQDIQAALGYAADALAHEVILLQEA